jgi:hypothetical protein
MRRRPQDRALAERAKATGLVATIHEHVLAQKIIVTHDGRVSVQRVPDRWVTRWYVLGPRWTKGCDTETEAWRIAWELGHTHVIDSRRVSGVADEIPREFRVPSPGIPQSVRVRIEKAERRLSRADSRPAVV